MIASLALTTVVRVIRNFNTQANASSKTVYDLSECQGRLTNKTANTLRPLVGSRKILFYSYLSFIQIYVPKELDKYDGYWVASLTSRMN